ncbi:unnamed protein product [Calypogeia fissa]
MSSNSDLVKWIAGAFTAALVCAGLLFLRKGCYNYHTSVYCEDEPGPQTGGSSAMGGPSSLHPSLNREDDKINDSVWELYSPKGKPAVEIIFFHGLQLGALFYGTPHAGSEQIELLAKRLSSKSPLLKLMKVLATDTARINGSFRQIRSNLDAKILAIGEGLETKTNGFNGMVVVEASARNDVNEYCTHTKADHFTVCKARHKKDPTVIEKLAQFINSTLEETSRQQAHALVTR